MAKVFFQEAPQRQAATHWAAPWDMRARKIPDVIAVDLNKERDVSFCALNPLLPHQQAAHPLARVSFAWDIPALRPLPPHTHLLKLKRSRSKTRTGPVLLKMVRG